MRKIINLTQNTYNVMDKIINLYDQNKDILTMHRGEEHYTVKYGFNDGYSIVADVIVAPECYRFHVAQESSALMMRKPAFQPFNVGLTLKNNRLKFHSMPQQKEAMDWLTQKDVKTKLIRADVLVMLATVCEMIWSFLLPCMKVREYGDCIEYAPRDDFMTFADEWIQNFRRQYKETHRLDGWDVINLTTKQLVKMGETLEEHHILHDFDNIAIHKFCVVLYNNAEKYTQYYFITHTGTKLHFEVEDDRTPHAAYCDVTYSKELNDELSLQLEDDTNAMDWLTQSAGTEDGKEITHWQWMVDLFFSINSFMLHFGDVTMEVETKQAIAPSEGRSQKHHNQRSSVRLFKSYKLVKGWKSKARKKAEITCPAWGVRGHFRHYRNGKVIFIESYVKGPEKDNYKGKEYALLPYKDA